MSKTTEAIERVLKEGVSEGQKQTGVPVPPLTREQREKAAVKIVAAWYVRAWNALMGFFGVK